MNLGRQDISATTPTQIIDVRFDADSRIFTCSTPSGFAVYRSYPLNLVRKREITGGTISIVQPLHSSSLLFLVGGGRSPKYPPNKVVFWDDAQGKEVAELEFKERVRGIACRRGTLAVALKRRVVVFEITDTVRHVQEWRTGENERGLVALATAPGATLMAIPAITSGYLHLVNLSPCPSPPEDHTPGAHSTHHTPRPLPAQPRKDHIKAHDSALATISVTPSGRMVATTSETGTLVRIWDVVKGQNSHEFRRGMDQAHIYGVAFRPDEKECCAWSDKGTVHVYSLDRVNRTSVLRQVTAILPVQNNYLNSEWSYAQYRLPTPPAHVAHSMSTANRLGTSHPDAGDEERWTVGWITLPPDTTPQSSPAKVTSPLSPSRSKAKGRAELPGSPLRGTVDRKLSSSITPRQSPRPDQTPEYQLIALTFTGGWYRLSLPNNEPKDRAGTPEPYQGSGRSAQGGRRSENERKMGSPQPGGSRRSIEKTSPRRNSDAQNDSGKCQLEEFRRFGRWDGWG